MELEKKIQNLEEKLRRCSKREGELEDEVVRLTSIIKTINSSTLSKQDLERLTIGALQVASTEEKMGRLRNQMSVFGGLMRSQFDKLRSSGVKL